MTSINHITSATDKNPLWPHRAAHVVCTTLLVSMMVVGCSSENSSNDTPPVEDVSDMEDMSDMGTDEEDGGEVEPEGTSCDQVQVSEFYDDAGAVGECTTGQGKVIADSMMDVTGITIDNSGEDETPCVRVMCDEDYAYIISNDIPHYDFVVLTPNELVEAVGVHRIPLAPSPPAGTDAVDIETLDGCTDMYEAYLAGDVPRDEPLGFCGDGYLRETTASGEKTYGKITCLNQNAIMTSGVMANGPNEGDVGVWGDPGLEPFNERAAGPGASLDFCGGHTGRSMHYHFAYEACFAKNEDRTPDFSYAIIGTEFDLLDIIDGECTAPSGILGWSIDGYPIKGPCVCVTRDEQGDCTEVKRARSSWLYTGIGVHSSTPNEALMAVEGKTCETTADCCGEGRCDFTCTDTVTPGENAGSQVQPVCTFLRHAWCTREYTNMEEVDTSAQNFVYMDTCNGYEGPDGFAYHAIGTFPYLQSCFHGEPIAQANTGGDGNMGGGGNEPVEPTDCTEDAQQRCCGDDICDGPETAENCPVDCP